MDVFTVQFVEIPMRDAYDYSLKLYSFDNLKGAVAKAIFLIQKTLHEIEQSHDKEFINPTLMSK